MNRRDDLLWGAVGALAFLVLAQGYRLAADRGPGLLALLAVAVAVGTLAALLARAAARLVRKRRV